MSAYTYFYTYSIPPPVRLDTFRAGEVDERAIDFSRDLTPYGDRLESIISIEVISRDDGQSLGAGDLVVISDDPEREPAIDGSGSIIGWWQTSSDSVASNGITIEYIVSVKAMTMIGRTIICDAYQLVAPVRG